MFFSKANSILKGENALDLVPIAKHGYIADENNRIVLQVPKFKNEGFARWFIPRRKSTFYSIKLDELGTKVYGFVDGQRNIAKICGHVNDNESQPINDIEERAVAFLNKLYKYRFITFGQLINHNNLRR